MEHLEKIFAEHIFLLQYTTICCIYDEFNTTAKEDMISNVKSRSKSLYFAVRRRDNIGTQYSVDLVQNHGHHKYRLLRANGCLIVPESQYIPKRSNS